MVRFLHTADWQLGMTRRYLSAEAQARFAAARIEAIRSIARVATERGCEFVVCAGDVFEHAAIDRRVVLRALEAMAEVPVPVFLLPGNHDPLDAGSIYTSAAFSQARPGNVVVLEPGAAHRPVEGVEVLGAPWPSKRPLTDLVADACADLRSDGVLRVLVAHGAVDRGAPDPDDPALIGLDAAEAALAAGCLHYLALGDRHSCTDVGPTGRVRYAGAPEPTDFDEAEPGKVLVVDLAEGRCEVEAVQVGTWRFTRERWALGGAEDVAALEGWLGALPAKDRTVVRLVLGGTLPLRDASRLEDVLARARDTFAAVDVFDDAALHVLPDDEDFSGLALSGFAEETLAELRSLAGGSDPEAELARDALALLHRLAVQPGAAA
jgi:DNA repair exonuclease SbcCD nuclease subunit